MDFTDTPAGPRLKVVGDSRVDDFRANSVQGTAVAGVAPAAQPGVAAAAAATAGTPVKTAVGASGKRGSSASAITAERVASRASGGEEALSWRALELRGVDVDMAPGVTTTVVVKETALSDFYARVILLENGRLNLQDVVKSDPAASSASPTATIASQKTPDSVAKKDQKTLATGQKDSKNAAQVAQGGGAPGAVVTFGPMSLSGGRVYFSDRFIKPNYSADLTELTGRLSGFSSVASTGSPQMADLELRGKAAAPLLTWAATVWKSSAALRERIIAPSR